MSTNRIVKLTLTPKPTLEGAGVRLKRGFGFGQEHAFDPFLLFDDFSGNCPADYQAGFPWHPHRGIETITYLLEGNVDHGDSLGNAGSIQAGDVQWMTAGSGIIHQEMPHGNPEGRMSGFQLWANLPASQKMMAPRYQGLESRDIPLIEKPGLTLRVIGGKVDGVRGPARDIVIQPEYLDIKLNALAEWQHPTPPGHTVFAYLFQGSAKVEENSPDLQGENGLIVLFNRWRFGQHQGWAERCTPAADQRKTGARAHCLGWTDCDEHAGRAANCVRGVPRGNIYQKLNRFLFFPGLFYENEQRTIQRCAVLSLICQTKLKQENTNHSWQQYKNC